MAFEKIQSDGAPAAVGAYSQAVRAGDFVFVSGQLGMDPSSGQLVSNDIRLQTAQVLANIKAILAAAGAGIRDVVRAEIYLADMADFSTVNELYAAHFVNSAYPARQCLAVKELPKGALVEISCIAYVGSNR